MARAKEVKPPTLRERANAQRVLCRDCPAWGEYSRPDGSNFPIPITDDKEQSVVKDGVQQMWRHKDGRVVTQGACQLMRVQRTPGFAVGFPEARSDWWCEDPEKLALIARLTAPVGNPDA